MGAESIVMKEIISETSQLFPLQLAFHTHRQSKDYYLNSDPIIVGNGFDKENYFYISKEIMKLDRMVWLHSLL